MINRVEYERLKLKYGGYSSWAIWDYSNEKDTSIIERNFDQLHSRYVFVGLNISDILSIVPWINFHGGKHDRKLKYACNDNSLKGSYITDLFKGIPEPQANRIDQYLSEEIIDQNVDLFKQEMEDIKISEDSTFIILGGKVERYFDLYYKKNYPKNKVIYYSHYSAHGTDKEWVEGLWNKLGITDDFEKTREKYINNCIYYPASTYTP